MPEQREGQTLYFGYSGYLAQNFPISDTKYQIIMQWHHEGDSGSPPLAIHARDNQLILAGGDNDEHQAYEQPIGPARADMPVMHHMALSPDGRFVLSGGGERNWHATGDYDLRLWRLPAPPAPH